MSGSGLIWVTPGLNPHPENRRVRHPAEATKWDYEKYHHGNGETKSANNCHVEK
jgi:hypothetical protein